MAKSIFEVETAMINGQEHVVIDESNNDKVSLSELEEYALELESYYEDEDLRHFTQVQDARMNRRIMR